MLKKLIALLLIVPGLAFADVASDMANPELSDAQVLQNAVDSGLTVEEAVAQMVAAAPSRAQSIVATAVAANPSSSSSIISAAAAAAPEQSQAIAAGASDAGVDPATAQAAANAGAQQGGQPPAGTGGATQAPAPVAATGPTSAGGGASVSTEQAEDLVRVVEEETGVDLGDVIDDIVSGRPPQIGSPSGSAG